MPRDVQTPDVIMTRSGLTLLVKVDITRPCESRGSGSSPGEGATGNNVTDAARSGFTLGSENPPHSCTLCMI